jgi:hypothetical protein
MNVHAVDRRHELRQCIQLRFKAAPVVICPPIAREFAHRRELHPLRRIGYQFSRRPFRRGDPPTQVRERLIGRVEPERPDCVVVGLSHR